MTELLEEALAEVGRVVQVDQLDRGWKVQIEPWEEVRLRRKRLRWCLLRLPPPPHVMYEAEIDRDLAITSCAGGEDAAVIERVMAQLHTALRRKPEPPRQAEAEWEEWARGKLIGQALGEVGRVVRLMRVEEGWEVQLEPWEELKLRRRRSARYLPPRLHAPPVIYELRLGRDFAITSCTGAEDTSLAEQLVAQLRTAIDRRVREPIERQEEEEALRRPRVPPAELEREYQEAKRREEWARTASFLENEALELILFGGKGGAGKTTSAAATGLRLARLRPEKRILIVSIDPAHSLADSLDCPVGGEPTPVNGLDNLWAMELDAPKLHDEFRARHDGAMQKIAYRGSIFDPRDIADIFSLALPGIDEFMAIVEIANTRREGNYDLIILDTAPTGHTLRLLALPELMLQWMRVFDLMQAKHRYLSRHLSGHYRKDDADAFIELMVRDVRRVWRLLTNIRIAEFIPVTIPEPLSIHETERLVGTLADYRIPVKSIILNRLAMGDGCPFCLARRGDQKGHIAEIDERFASYNLFRMPLFDHEIRGMDGLTQYAGVLAGEPYQYVPSPAEPLAERPPIPSASMARLLERDARFFLFSGKGGVGKTTAAAATALALARRNPDKKVLAFSIDPAHSLADSFDCPIGNEVVSIPGVDNLYGIELDPDKLWEELKQDYREDMAEIIDRFLGSAEGSGVQFEREASTEFIELTPPGLNEIMALEKLMDLYEEGSYDLFVVDSAATGHMMRFLELPEIIRDWMQVLFKLLLKYRRVVRLADLPKAGWRLLRTSRHISQIRAAFVDPERTDFVAVTIPEAMGVLETNDLFATLEKLNIPCRHLVMNMMIPPTECDFCAAKRNEQERYLRQMDDSKPPDCTMTQVPQFPHQIRGIEALTSLSEIMFAS